MSLRDILTGGGGIILLLLTLIQIAPIKINPWTALVRWLGQVFNGDVLREQKETRSILEEHIRVDDERDADMHRARILQFNTELLRGIRHTEEDFNEIFYSITCYNRYCQEHPKYENNRAVRAIANVNRVYDDLAKTRDFL